VEFDSLAAIREEHGPGGLTGLVASPYGRPGLVTDDTQMALFTAEALLDPTPDVGSALHAAYLRWLATQETGSPPAAATGLAARPWLYAVRAPGNACLSGLRSGRRGTLDDPVNPGSKGCGTVMRAAPFGLVRAFTTAEQAVDAAFAGSALTHGHPTAHHSAAALALLVRSLVTGLDLATAVDDAIATLRRRPDHEETVAALRAAVDAARRGPGAEVLVTLGEGWVAEEALAMGVYCALVHPGPADVRAALLLAVNHGGDSDSTGAITGNLVGARHGEEALPADWVEVVEGRVDVVDLADRLAGSGAGPALRAPDAPLGAAARHDRLSRVRGLLLGLALGDALTRPDQPVPGVLRGTSTTQLACATVEGLIRARVRADHRGIGPVPEVIWHAYRRWGTAQGIDGVPPVPLDGWLFRVPAMAQRRGDAPATVAALTAPDRHPRVGPPTSGGHHAVTRTLPLACVDVHRYSVKEVAAWTHGDRRAIEAAEEVVRLAAALLAGVPFHRVPGLSVRSSTRPLATIAPDHTARSAALGGIALAGNCPGADAVADTLRSARSAPASAPGVGPVAGALLGARFGAEALPVEDVSRLELGWTVDTLARDLVAQVLDRPGGSEYGEAADRHWWGRYPGG
jgi:ADP-ribosylglycohydrolase